LRGWVGDVAVSVVFLLLRFGLGWEEEGGEERREERRGGRGEACEEEEEECVGMFADDLGDFLGSSIQRLPTRPPASSSLCVPGSSSSSNISICTNALRDRPEARQAGP